MSHKFTIGEYTTEDGRKAVILSDQFERELYSLVGVVKEKHGSDWTTNWWTEDGHGFMGGTTLVLPRTHWYVPVFRNGLCGCPYPALEDEANFGEIARRVAILHLTYGANDKLVEVEFFTEED